MVGLTIPLVFAFLSQLLTGGSAEEDSRGTPREGSDDPTRSLRALAEEYGPLTARVPVDGADAAPAPAPALLRASPDAGSAYGSTESLEALADLERRPEPVPQRQASAPQEALPGPVVVPVPVTPEVPRIAATTASPGLAREVQLSAARRLYTIATTTTAAQRGPLRAEIASNQRALGLEGDGLIGRQTAARVREVSGLRIPGLT